MAEHANEYLTLAVRISQGRIANSLSPVQDQRGKCSTAHRGMPRTALAPFSVSARFGLAASACQHFSFSACATEGWRDHRPDRNSRSAQRGGASVRGRRQYLLTSVELK